MSSAGASFSVVECKPCSISNAMALPCEGAKVYRLSSTKAAIALLQDWPESERPLVIGAASNLILPEQLSRPCLQLTSQALQFETLPDQSVRVHAEAGLLWDKLVARCVAEGLRGLENLSWIPGTVGAAPVQNIGAYGVELDDVLEEVQAYDFERNAVRTLDVQACRFAYRDSIFKQQPGRFVILSVSMRLTKDRPFTLDYGEMQALAEQPDLSVAQVREKVIQVRQAKLPDPDQIPNAGSFFKNPIISAEQAEALRQRFPKLVHYPMADGQVKLAAGWLIDQAGWKGARQNRAGVHGQQALVLTNLGQARQSDVLALAEEIRQSVRERYQVELEIEPIVVSG